MTTDTVEIDKGQLVRLLDGEFTLGITSITFLPKGEEAYTYVAEGRDGRRHFVRVQKSTPVTDWELVFTVTTALRSECGFSSVVAPYKTGGRAFTCWHAGHTVAVFPFLEGRTAYEEELSDQGLAQAAGIIAALHQRGGAIAVPGIPRESFEHPFEAPILRALRAAGEADGGANDLHPEVLSLLREEGADILATLEKMKRLRAAARGLEIECVLTHGDPNLDNFLVDREGSVHLTDWGEVAFGPPERDLTAFTGRRFERFLEHYACAWKRPKLHPEVCAFYFYRWCLQEIADYATRILFENRGPAEEEHAWAELQPYLPIRHDAIAQWVRELEVLTDV